MINATNQTVLTLLAQMKAKTGRGSTPLENINVNDAQLLVDFVNNTAKSPDSGLAALTIAMQNTTGFTSIANIISAATLYDTFIFGDKIITIPVLPPITS